MRFRLTLLLLALWLPISVSALELVANGDFEEELTPAWTTATSGAATVTVRATTFDGDPDYEALAQKGTGNGHAKISQVMVVPSLDLDLSAALRCEAYSSPGGPWAVGGLVIDYEDLHGNVLGTTLIGAKTSLCPWHDSGTFHWIAAPDQNWNDYALNLADEIVNLYDVDPADVQCVRMTLTGLVGGDC